MGVWSCGNMQNHRSKVTADFFLLTYNKGGKKSVLKRCDIFPAVAVVMWLVFILPGCSSDVDKAKTFGSVVNRRPV